MPVSIPTMIASGILVELLALGMLAVWDLYRFMARVPRLNDWDDLDMYKRMVSRHMHGSLIGIVLLVVVVWVSCVGIMVRWMPFDELLVVVLFGVPFGPFSLLIRRVESRVMTLPAASDEIADERDRVVRVWVSRLLPDW